MQGSLKEYFRSRDEAGCEENEGKQKVKGVMNILFPKREGKREELRYRQQRDFRFQKERIPVKEEKLKQPASRTMEVGSRWEGE